MVRQAHHEGYGGQAGAQALPLLIKERGKYQETRYKGKYRIDGARQLMDSSLRWNDNM
jgi:hypothetical protein